jgi:hypothetical protein
MNANKLSVYPTVGQVVHVLHRSALNKNGVAYLERDGHQVRTIKQVHVIDSGLPTIMDDVGDTWTVQPSKLGEWETCHPIDV